LGDFAQKAATTGLNTASPILSRQKMMRLGYRGKRHGG
jgi:hypothetical protein